MLNIEKYLDEFVKLAYDESGIAIVNNRPTMCVETTCSDCDCFYQGMGCREYVIRWARSEYVEHPKLTQKERQFCELVETGWIAKDNWGDLFWYRDIPYKGNCIWFAQDTKYMVQINYVFPMLNFDCIKWEDEEPWAVEDLLKLEVEE